MAASAQLRIEVVEHEATGLLVPPGDPAAAASALLRLAGDAALRERCVEAASRRLTDAFDIRSMVRELDRELAAAAGDDIAAIRARLAGGADALAGATRWLVETYPSDPRAVAAGAVHYLRLLGIVAGGWLMARAAAIAAVRLAADDGDTLFWRAKLASARFFADHVLIQAGALADAFTTGAASVLSLEEDLI